MKKTVIIFFLFYCNIYVCTQDICVKDIIKYKEAYNYLIKDSIMDDKSLFVSDTVVDMDRFYFHADVIDYPEIKTTIDSLKKYTWNKGFSSEQLREVWKNQNPYSESILFFSLVEKNTLRADLFINRYSLANFNYDDIIYFNRDKVYAYLFVFNKQNKLERVFRREIIYGI